MDKNQEKTRNPYSRKKIDRGIYERIGKNGKKSYQVIVQLRPHPPVVETFDRLVDARKWQENTKVAIRDGVYFKTAEAKKHTFGELIDRYILDVLPSKEKAKDRQGAQLIWWKNELGKTILSNLTPAMIAEKRDKLGRENTKRGRLRTPATVVRYLAALSHALSIAVKEWGWLEDSPMRKVTKPREPRGRVRFLSSDERERLLKACRESSNAYLYPVVVLALSTGMRQGEIMSLKWPDVDFQRRRITLNFTKNGERRSIPIAGLALQLLEDLYRRRCRIDTHLLFPSKEDPKKPMDLRFPWEQALKAAKVDSYRFHDNRHSAASELAMNGASLVEIAAILGHQTISMVKRYSHLSESHTAVVVTRMNEKVFG